MWSILSFTTLVLGFTTKGFAFNIEINGNFSNGSTFCAGDNIILYCFNGHGAFTWNISALSLELSLTLSDNLLTSIKFTAERLSFHNSSLSFTAIPELNDSIIVCKDNAATGDVLLTVDIGIFSPPSKPKVNIIAMAYNIINIVISPSGSSADCRQNVMINISTTMDMFFRTATMPISAVTTVIFENLNLHMYNYTIIVIAMDLSGRMSDPYMGIATVALLTDHDIKGTSSVTASSGTDSINGSGTSMARVIGIVIGVVLAAILAISIIIGGIIFYMLYLKRLPCCKCLSKRHSRLNEVKDVADYQRLKSLSQTGLNESYRDKNNVVDSEDNQHELKNSVEKTSQAQNK